MPRDLPILEGSCGKTKLHAGVINHRAPLTGRANAEGSSFGHALRVNSADKDAPRDGCVPGFSEN